MVLNIYILIWLILVMIKRLLSSTVTRDDDIISNKVEQKKLVVKSIN